MSAPAATTRPRARPRWRGREARLLVLVAVVLGIGWVSLASTQAARPTIGDARALFVLLGMLALVHLALTVDGHRRDQVLLPVVGLLMGLSILLMSRLPQDLVVQRIGSLELPLVSLQLLWIGLSLGIAAVIAVGLRNDLLLRSYKYTWAAAGIVLLLLVFVFGDETNGARLTLRIGPFAGQPSELLKIILVVFLAAYLADNRALLAGRDSRLGPIRLPPLLYLLPMVAMWGLALAIVIVQRDLGAALLFYSVFLVLLYVATQRRDLVVIGVALFVAGGAVLFAFFPHVQERVQIWLDPFATAQGAGYQIVRGLYALGRGGVLGTGLGAGLPGVGGAPSIPAVHTDFVFAALGEELGLVGGLAILVLYADLRRARPAHRGRRAGRVPSAAGGRADAGHRRPGRHHRGRQCQAHAADRHHPALVATADRRCWPTARSSACCWPSRSRIGRACRRSRSAGGTGSLTRRVRRPGGSSGWSGDAPGPGARGCRAVAGPALEWWAAGHGARPAPGRRRALHRLRRDRGRPRLVGCRGSRPADRRPAQPARARRPRGAARPDLDARGVVLAESVRDGEGGYIRHYPHPEAAPVVGYLSPRFGAAGLERSYAATAPRHRRRRCRRRAAAQVPARSIRPRDLLLSLDLRLQRRAMRLLRGERGAIVAIEPSTGRILAMASTPTYDPNLIVDPETGAALLPVVARPAGGSIAAARPGHAGRLYAGLGAQDRDRGGRARGATPSRRRRSIRPAGRGEDGLPGRRLQGPRRPASPRPATGLNLDEATEVSCNI